VASNPPRSSRSHPRGRPRSQRARRAILEAARALVEKGGYPATTIEAIAARSGVAKTTIYRWWPNRASLIVDLLVQVSADVAPPPVGRNPLQALRTELYLVAKAADALPGRLLGSLLGDVQSDPQIRDALRRGLFNPRRRATASVIRRAQQQGQLDPRVPPLVAVDLLYGPLFYRSFIRHEPLTHRFVTQVIEHVLGGLAPKGRSFADARRAATDGRRSAHARRRRAGGG
jgi:AcrR family transcriptional regulator